MSAEEKQWRRLAIEALQFIGELERECPTVRTRCERFTASVIGEHCGPLILPNSANVTQPTNPT